jgi:UDP-N-acetylmuramoyl-tripeptide--D-alanyl-D-alanine ligase
MFWNCATIADTLAAHWLTPKSSASLTPGISTDTRAISRGALFIALRGEKHDAHAYLDQAISGGAAMLLIDRAEAFDRIRDLATTQNVAVILVPDTAAALLSLASAYRDHLAARGATFIAVGGSNGKTTTVRMLHAALSQSLRGTSSQKSFNNAIGVPITVLSAREDDQFVICEVGTNAPGELEPLSRTIRPDIVVLTSLGREHLEGLGSLEGVAREEAQLVRGLRPGGVLIAPCDEPGPLLLTSVRDVLTAENNNTRTITFGLSHPANLRVVTRSQSFAGITVTLADGLTFTLPTLGLHNATNAAAAIAVARTLKLPDQATIAGLARVQPPPMRLERHIIHTRAASIRIINDAYNANPESMLAAIATMCEVQQQERAQRLVLVLGDMLELGDHTAAMHTEVVQAAAAAAPDLLALLGPHMARAAQETATQALTRETTTPADCDAIAAALQPGDLVLLKGSRGTAVERVLTSLQSRYATWQELKPAAVQARA